MTVLAIRSPDYLNLSQIRQLARSAGASVPKAFFHGEWSASDDQYKTKMLARFLADNSPIARRIAAEGCGVQEKIIEDMSANDQLTVLSIVIRRTFDSVSDRRQVEDAIIAGLADYVSSEITRKLNGE